VRNEANIGLVDPHAKRNGCHHNHALFGEEPALVFGSSLSG
jgi:hypothetical protein